MQALKRRGKAYGEKRQRLPGGPGPAAGNPGGRRTKSLPALLADALNETVVMTIDGRRRKLTKREAIVTQMVESADLRATKLLIDMMKDIEQKARRARWERRSCGR
jgi:hypothetical protein